VIGAADPGDAGPDDHDIEVLGRRWRGVRQRCCPGHRFGPFPAAATYTLFERRNPYAIADVACSIGDAKGEYRRLACRNDADLKAWPATRPAAGGAQAGSADRRSASDSRAG
jgi:hypothetical protein